MGKSDVLMFLMFFLFISFVSAENGLIFYVTDGHDGNFGGRSGADDFCVASKSSNLSCDNIHAFLSVDSSDEIRDMPSNYGYSLEKSLYWYNPSAGSFSKFAENWNDAMDASIIVSARNGTGMDLYMGAYWTGSYVDGSSDEVRSPGYGTCNGWKDKSYQRHGTSSNGKEKDFEWIYKSGKYSCNTKHRVVCICEGDEVVDFGTGDKIIRHSSDKIYMRFNGYKPIFSDIPIFYNITKWWDYGEYSMTLNQMIKNGYLSGDDIPDANLELDGVIAHNPDEVFVSVNGVESNLKNVVNLCGNVDSHYSSDIVFGHTGDEISVTVNGKEKTLQSAINDGDFCCVSDSWTPLASQVPCNEYFTQVNKCGMFSSGYGTKDCCTSTSWTPDPSTIKKGESFFQTGDCGDRRSSVGTSNYREKCWKYGGVCLSSPISASGSEYCEHTSNCNCNGEDYCGNWPNGKMVKYWPNGCSGMANGIVCSIEYATPPL